MIAGTISVSEKCLICQKKLNNNVHVYTHTHINPEARQQHTVSTYLFFPTVKFNYERNC